MIELRDFVRWFVIEMLQHLLAAVRWVTAIPRHVLTEHVNLYEESVAGGNLLLAVGTGVFIVVTSIGSAMMSMFQGAGGSLVLERMAFVAQMSLALAVCYALVVLFVVKFRKFRRQRQEVIDNLKKDYK